MKFPINSFLKPPVSPPSLVQTFFSEACSQALSLYILPLRKTDQALHPYKTTEKHPIVYFNLNVIT
jgi:hypothetical protein